MPAWVIHIVAPKEPLLPALSVVEHLTNSLKCSHFILIQASNTVEHSDYVQVPKNLTQSNEKFYINIYFRHKLTSSGEEVILNFHCEMM